MRENLLVAILIIVAGACEMLDVLSKIIDNYLFQRRKYKLFSDKK